RAGGFVSTIMTWSAYRTADQAGREMWPDNDAGAPDQLSVAATAGRSEVFVELADRNGSRIVLANGKDLNAAGLRISNADYPAVSADGTSIAYIREEKGRGSLWTAHLVSSSGGVAAIGEAKLVGIPYDVRDAAFAPSGDIVFTARLVGRTAIYQV